MISVDTALVLAGLLAFSDKPVEGKRLFEVRSAFYKKREEYVVDISSKSVLSVTQRYDWFDSTDDGVVLGKLKGITKEGLLDLLLGTCIYKDEIKGILKEFIEKEK